jgi:hypothetical protein
MEDTKPKGRLNRTKRDVETRATQERPKQWKAPEILPEIDKEEGYSYRFVRTSTMGVPDAKNVSAKFREGWEPVKASEHPEAFAMTDQNSQFEDSIEIGGLLLCKTDEELTKQRDEYYSKKTGQVMESVDNNFMRDQDPRMPMFNDRKSKTTFGKG